MTLNIKTFCTLVAFTLTSCITYTPMSSQTIEDLTTCKKSDLKKIKKNLQLAGYEIKSESNEDLTTEYKQISGYGAYRDYEKITVVKIDEENFRFLVKERSDSVSSVSTGTTLTTKTRINKQGKVETYTEESSNSTPIATSNEREVDYVIEKLPIYEERQYKVCGR